MDFVVKNTTKNSLLDLICPHSCRGCGELGQVLCERCKNNIIRARLPICPLCRRQGENLNWRCADCESPFKDFWVVGWREGVLAQVVSEFKYQSVRAIGLVLVEMIDDAIPENFGRNDEVVVVPLPTIGKHVRERGLDHTKILAKKLAKKRGWKHQRLLGRATDTVQVGTKASERQKQAENTYEIIDRVNPKCQYLLLDDVWTTGATMLSAAKVMQEAGAKELYGVVIEVGKVVIGVADDEGLSIS